MYQRYKERFGTVGVVLGVIALVLALGGAAFAAGGLTKSQEKQVKKLAKQEAQKYANSNPGAPGQNGTNGTNGKDGAPGEKGEKGESGASGKSVVLGTATTTPVTGECPTVGGTTVEVEGTPASKKHVCNGKEGSFGSGTTLPKGQTLTGVWAAEGGASGDRAMAVMSFPIPLSQAPTIAVAPANAGGNWYEIPAVGEVELHEGNPGDEFGETCEGSDADPTAPAGFLCVYTTEETEIGPPGFEWFAGGRVAPTQYGAHLSYKATGTPGFVDGTWAVTAP